MGDEADAMNAWEMSDAAAEFSERILYRHRRKPPTETVMHFPKRKHTHPTSPRKAKP